jgi:hypothetical protein
MTMLQGMFDKEAWELSHEEKEMRIPDLKLQGV